ncbi:MAG: LemA family protein [Ferruginibacter sp.]|uniref:LemA family protein n=1 Tax=Ferruginibacter sp. TaxID=1940288 RepID=UPI002658D828|nr:LemA family protein [Ferruginibacter sp.]MDB5276155.1 LemA family protein [Ferruginibacter sp.]
MKLFLQFTIILFLLYSQNSFGQDTATSIEKNWAILKTQLQRRTNIVINFIQTLNNSNKDKKELAKLKMIATGISKYLDTLKQFDSLSIDVTMKKNHSLNKILTKTITSIENDKKFNKRNDVMNLMAQLEGAENRIVVARYEYNKSCKTFNRPDLQFREKEDAKAVRVEF